MKFLLIYVFGDWCGILALEYVGEVFDSRLTKKIKCCLYVLHKCGVNHRNGAIFELPLVPDSFVTDSMVECIME